MTPLLLYAQVVQGCYDDDSVPTFQDAAGLTHVYVVEVNGIPHINFQGTLDAAEWINRDLDAIGRESFAHPTFGLVHDGFMRGVIGVMTAIDVWLADNGLPAYTLGGHSKGAGEAQLAAAELARRGHPPSALYLFEPPRAGTDRLQRYLKGIPTYATQTYNAEGNDLVTEVPTPPWVNLVEPLRLRVPDTDDVATKHKIPAVIAALRGVSS